jgi:hypothetical protein
MSSSRQFMAATLTAAPEIFQAIQKGLRNGDYVREGGAILDTDGGQKVVAWLRDAAGGQSSVKMLNESLGMLTAGSAELSVLNLSISAIGFAVVLQRLGTIERKIDALAQELKEIGWKLDSALYSDFRGGLQVADDAFAAKQKTNRRAFATQAINTFAKVENSYLALVGRDLQTTGGRGVEPLFEILSLAMVSEARCRLELGEVEIAKNGLEKNVQALVSPCKEYFDSVIDTNPAIFLHPDLADWVSLERMAQLWRHREPAMTSDRIFERLRKRLWETAGQNPRSWVSSLPPYFQEGKKDWLTVLRIQGEEALKRASSVAEAARNRAELPDRGAEQWRRMVPKLANAFAQVESTYETLGRLRGFQSELEFLLAHDVGFAEWQRLTFPRSEPGSYGLIIPLDSALVPEQARVSGD